MLSESSPSLTIAGSVTSPSARSRPPQLGHASTSTSKLRRRRDAQSTRGDAADALESGALETEPESHIPDPPAAVAVAQDAAPARRQRQRPVVLWIAAAATVVVAAGALYAALSQPPRSGPVPPAPSPSTPAPLPPAVPDLVAAVDLRHQARAACDAKQWTACLAKLDQARAADPDRDDAPTAKALRDRATAGLAKKPDPPLP